MQTSETVLSGEAGQILGVSAERVRAMERTGQLRAVKTARGVRLFDRRDVERLALERQAKRAGAGAGAAA